MTILNAKQRVQGVFKETHIDPSKLRQCEKWETAVMNSNKGKKIILIQSAG